MDDELWHMIVVLAACGYFRFNGDGWEFHTTGTLLNEFAEYVGHLTC